MKILIVAMTDSVHLARWVSQVSDKYDIHIFPSILGGVAHQDLYKYNVCVHDDFLAMSNSRVVVRLKSIFKLIGSIADLVMAGFNKKKFQIKRLAKLIERLKPDIVHTLEFQSSGYLFLNTRETLRNKPKWIATNWGSDIYYFARFKDHRKKINKILSSCDYYSCECDRDVCLAKKHGLAGKVLPVFPNAGGFDLDVVSRLSSGKTSNRKKIALKGYQNWAGRALVGLAALEKCEKLLVGYEIIVFSADEETIKKISRLRKKGSLNITVLKKNSPREDILRLHGASRISIGLSISDAISTSMLEAMVMGSFPIQSNTACADEWVKNGKSGLIVPPEDIKEVVLAIKKALSDDNMVDEASKINWQTAQKRLDATILREKTINFYEEVFEDAKR